MVKNKDILEYLDSFPNLKEILSRSKNKNKESLVGMLIENCLNVSVEPEAYLKEIENKLQFGVENLDANSNGEWKKKITEDNTGYNTTIAQFELGQFLKQIGLDVKIADDLEIIYNNEKINIEIKTFADVNLWHECNYLLDKHKIGNIKILYEKVKTIIDLEKFDDYNDKVNWIYRDIIKKLEQEVNLENFDVENFEYEGKKIFEKSQFSSTDVISIDKEIAKKQITNTLNAANMQLNNKFIGRKNLIFIDIKNSNVDLNKMKRASDFYEILLGNKIILANKYPDGRSAKDWAKSQINTNHIDIDKSAFETGFNKLYVFWFKTEKTYEEKTNYSYIKSKGLFFNEEFKSTSGVLIRDKDDKYILVLNPFSENKITEEEADSIGLGDFIFK